MSLATTINLLLAIICGGAIGFERQWHQGMAGLRTNTLVAFGSACFVTIGMHAGDDRVAAQIVSGMGFLGAGVILHEGPTVRGLNTAATLWCAAATGSLAAFGMRGEAFLAAIGVIAINLGLQRIQHRMTSLMPHPTDVEAVYGIEIACEPQAANQIQGVFASQLGELGGEIRSESRENLNADVAGQAAIRLCAEIASHSRLDAEIRTMIETVGALPGVLSARWSASASTSATSALAPTSRRSAAVGRRP